MGYSPWGHKESDRTVVTEHACTYQDLGTKNDSFLVSKTSVMSYVTFIHIVKYVCIHSLLVICKVVFLLNTFHIDKN